ncbi:SPOR domain-containing protein [Bartonella henselae]|uniref:SPOR domain-containing protein n=1 Tax=Bartonella henselae TaxID=38323 RepID=UPI001F1F7957|nr:SPOR domain-containing protein [Bartonella henselae]UJM33250.1 SPOR domain-containing protein [Bartonella henselae]
MSDNNRKNPYEMKQDYEHHNPLEKLTRIFTPNKQRKNQKDLSSLQIDQSISQPPKTSLHGDDFDLSFLEAEFENNLKNDLQLDEQKKQFNLHKTKNKTNSDVISTTLFNHPEKDSFLSEEKLSLPQSHNEEQILDALSPLPIQKNLSSQNKTSQTPAHPSFEESNFDPLSENFFFDESERQDNNRIIPELGEQNKRFSQTIAPQQNTSNIQQNYDDNQSLHNSPINHPYKVSADQENWIEEYYTNVPNPSMKANTGFSSATLISEREGTERSKSTSDFLSPLDSTQTNKSSDLKGFLQENHTDSYPQFYEEKLSEQETYAAQTPQYVDSQAQYINNAENISKQNNEKEVLYKQNNLNKIPSSSKVFKDTQTDRFFAHNTMQRDTSPPSVDTYKFSDEIVEKTGPIMVPEVPYEVPEYDVPTDGLKEEFSDVLNVGNVSAENFSQQKPQDKVFNEIFNQTIQNSKENTYINPQEESTNYFPADNTEHTESLSYKSVDEIPYTSNPLSLENSIFSKTLTKSIILLILIAVSFVGYSRFFMSSQKNESTPIIHADNTPFKFKHQSTETKNDVEHNLDIYKQTTGQNEKQENTQQFLIDNSEPPEDLAALNQQESTSLSPSSLDDSDVEDAVTEAINHTIPTQKVQTVIVKQDGTVVLSPMHDTEKKTTDKYEEKVDQTTVDQLQESQPISSHFSDTKDKEAEDNLTSNIDKIIAENISTSSVEKKVENSFVPLPSHAKSNSEVQTPASSHKNPPVQVRTQNSENYYVQLASQPTHALAKDSLKNMKSKFGFLIGTRPLNIQSAVIPGKGTYYRVRVQAQNRNEAINLCENIKNSGGSCFITR